MRTILNLLIGWPFKVLIVWPIQSLAVLVLICSGPVGWIILYWMTHQDREQDLTPAPKQDQLQDDWTITHDDRKRIEQ